MLYLEDAYVKYGEICVLSIPMFSISGGEIIHIMGPNGSGKSSFFHAIAGIGPKVYGVATYDQKEIAEIAPYDRPKYGIRLLPQRRCVFERLTPKEHTLLAENMLGDDLMFDTFSLEDVLRKSIYAKKSKDVSFGEAKIILLKSFSLGDVKLFMLDEPFAGLDRSRVLIVINLIENMKKRGASIIISDHTGLINKEISVDAKCVIVKKKSTNNKSYNVLCYEQG